MYIQSRNKQMMLNCVELAQYVKMTLHKKSLPVQYNISKTLKKDQGYFARFAYRIRANRTLAFY